ncbi:Biotin carboxylase [Actinopolyspora mzabensis]|uniref:Biotin carboxylase n=1 Tax=Actinopolyspora mzabensis TaxID=995066 RepID=A0A1G9A0S1_ACTMZ|nr:ATP-grasp domain-containing protein [Actinopolyspora mzabensis]SDK20946.1 Biotin carboxylase [Actinopolyspora mzabensis]
MRILVLNRFPLSSVRYREWIDGHELWLITSSSAVSEEAERRAAELAGFEEVVEIEAYSSSALLESHAHRLHREVAFDSVLAMSEFDLLRAARLRQDWNLPGQHPDSVIPYRDKHEMKRCLTERGIPVAEFDAVDDATGLLSFVRDSDLPVVVKPRRGASSEGVNVLRDSDELHEFLADGPLYGDHPAHLLAEKYIPNTMYNVDGIVVDGVIRVCWPSSTTSCLGFEDGANLVAAALEPDDPWCSELIGLVEAAVDALPTPATSIFHAEVFLTEDGELMLNEIGCRIGGAKVRDIIELAFGVDLVEWYVRALFSSGESRFAPPRRPMTQSGYVLVPPRPGTVSGIPPSCPVPGVAVYEPRVSSGERLGEPRSSIDCMVAIAATGSSRREVLTVLEQAAEWTENALDVR